MYIKNTEPNNGTKAKTALFGQLRRKERHENFSEIILFYLMLIFKLIRT